MCVCVCVCVCACAQVCVYIHVYCMCMCACIHVWCVYHCVYIHVHVHVHVPCSVPLHQCKCIYMYNKCTLYMYMYVQGMQLMYKKCRLIHADLSEYNLLWHRGRVVFIDVGQSVEPSHPNGLEFLLRDCRNVSGFFDRVGVKDVMGAHELFNYVSGLQIAATNDAEFLTQVCVYACVCMRACVCLFTYTN